MEDQVARAVEGAERGVVIFSANPIHDTGGGQRSAQLAVELLECGACVVFVSHGKVTETVDLGLRFPHPRLAQMTLREALSPGGLRALERVLSIRRALLITQVPIAAWNPVLRLARGLGAATVYDCIDRWDSELGRGWYRDSDEADVARASDVLIASAPELVRHVEELSGRRVALLPNAFNSRIFNRNANHGRPSDLPDGRVALYVGALWGGWLDWELARAAAEALPGTTFAYIGDRRREGSDLPENCVFLGLKPQTALPPYLANADVAFLPWRADDITRATSPLKVYEFVAMGLPVVAPSLETLRDIPGVILAQGPGEFPALLARTGRSTQDARTNSAMSVFAANNAWRQRVNDLLAFTDSERVATAPGREAPAAFPPRSSALLSVVIPAFNHEAFIGEAIDSVRAQTFGVGELVVLDDGSKDETGDVALTHLFPEMRYLRQENRGAHATINRAIGMTSGDYVAILNSDDAFDPERLEQVWGVARATGAALVVGDVRLVDESGRPLPADHPTSIWYREARAGAREGRSLLRAARRHNFAVTTSNFFLHRELWRRLGGFRSYRWVHDLDFLLRALQLCPERVRYEPSLDGVYYRIHRHNTIAEDAGKALTERAGMIRAEAAPLPRVARLVSGGRARRAVAGAIAVAGPVLPALRDEGSVPGRVERGLRVGLVVPFLDQGGLEEIVALLARSLPAQGVTPLVLCTHGGGAVAKRLTAAGVSVTVVDGKPKLWDAWCERVRPDVLSTHFADPDVIATLGAGGRPIVETVHNTYAWLSSADWKREAEKLADVAATVAVSATAAEYHARHCRTTPTAHVIPNAVHPGRAASVPRAFARRFLGLAEGVPVLLHLGRITLQKNLDGLLSVFADVVTEEPTATLILAGPTTERGHLRTLRRSHRRLFGSGAVRLEPPSADVGTLLSAADAFVSNSFFEGWSVAASEGLWAGLPLVLSDCGGSRELVGAGGERGRLVPNPLGDPLEVSLELIRRAPVEALETNRAALREALLDVIASKQSWSSRRAEIRGYARSELAPSRMSGAYARLFRSLAGGFRAE